MNTLKKQYTSIVSQQYIEETSNRKIRYGIIENLREHPEIYQEFLEWKNKQKEIIIPTFESVMHDDYKLPLFDIRLAEIREDWGQRNALTEVGRKSKILGMAKQFNVKLFEPISVDWIEDEDEFIIRDGGGRSHAAVMNGIFMVPASVRIISSFEESRKLFRIQDKNATAISKYDKFLQDLANSKSLRHNKACDTFALSKSAGISLHHSTKSTLSPLVEGLGILQKMLGSNYSGDQKGTKWGERAGGNIVQAIDIIKECFPENEEIPVSVLSALTAFVEVSKNRIPSGDAGGKRLRLFVNKIKESDSELENINNWVKVLKFDSSNNYDTYGASALMEKWNEVFKNANKGRKPKDFYKFVTWEDFEIEMISKNIFSFARDPSLFS